MRESKRAQNKERDMKLKERAQKNKVIASKPTKDKAAKGKGKADEEDELQARMERAMAEAQEESGDDESDDRQEFEDFEGINVGTDEDDEDDGESGSDEDSEGGNEDDSEVDGDDDDDEEEEEADEDDEEEQDVPPPSKSQKTKFNPDHLPDELFAAAFASKPKRKTDVELDTGADPNPPLKKRKPNTPKDIVIGYVIPNISPNLG